MTRAEWLFVIVWILNLLAALCYYLWGAFFYVPGRKLQLKIRKMSEVEEEEIFIEEAAQKEKNQEEYARDNRRTYLIRMIVMILCPIVGAAFFLCSHILYMTIFRQEVDLEDVVFSKERVRTHAKADEERERNLVPVEEALAVSDRKNLRALMLNVIKGDLKNSLESISLALNSEDSETSHYAASVLRDELNDFRVNVQRLYTAVNEEQEEETEAEQMMIDYMQRILLQKVFTDVEQKKFVNMMNEAAESLCQKKPTEMTPNRCKRLCTLLLDQEEFEKVKAWCDHLINYFPSEMESYTCRLRLYFQMGDRENFFEVLDQLKKSDTVIDSETLELIRVFS